MIHQASPASAAHVHNLFADLLAHVKLQNTGYFMLWLSDEQTPNETQIVRYHFAH
jgi:hypothetical protein